MPAMAALITVFLVVLVSVVITRVGTVALTLTGMSSESAHFQARSAFFGVGFTTSEAEAVVNHPVRRRILLLLMLIGNAGIISVIASLVLSFSRRGGQSLLRIGILAVGLVLLLLLARSSWLDRRLSRVIGLALRRWTDLDVRDYASLLELSGDYEVLELEVEPDDWIAERSLDDLRLRDEGIVVLGVQRQGGGYVGAPDGDTVIRAGDRLVVYGRTPRVCELDARRKGSVGDLEHARAVAEQTRIEDEEERQGEAPAEAASSAQ